MAAVVVVSMGECGVCGGVGMDEQHTKNIKERVNDNNYICRVPSSLFVLLCVVCVVARQCLSRLVCVLKAFTPLV